MRAQLVALVRVQTAFKQRPKNRRFNFRPIQSRCGVQCIQISTFQWQTRRIIKQAAIEPGDFVQPEPPTLVHSAEQIARQHRKL